MIKNLIKQSHNAILSLENQHQTLEIAPQIVPHKDLMEKVSAIPI